MLSFTITLDKADLSELKTFIKESPLSNEIKTQVLKGIYAAEIDRGLKDPEKPNQRISKETI